jgi:hypothetical protein
MTQLVENKRRLSLLIDTHRGLGAPPVSQRLRLRSRFGNAAISKLRAGAAVAAPFVASNFIRTHEDSPYAN